MKKPKRLPKRTSLQSAVLADLTEHVMDKVSEAAIDVVQLVDTEKEALSLYISGMLALLTHAILSSAPRTATRAEMNMAARMMADMVLKKYSATLDGISDDLLAKALRRSHLLR